MCLNVNVKKYCASLSSYEPLLLGTIHNATFILQLLYILSIRSVDIYRQKGGLEKKNIWMLLALKYHVNKTICLRITAADKG